MPLHYEKTPEHRTRHGWAIDITKFADRGVPVGDVYRMLEAAEARARELGVNTSCDDWLSVGHCDDTLEVWFETVRPDCSYCSGAGGEQ